MDRLTYKSSMGDYGSTKYYDSPMEEVYALRNALGKYEDLGMTPEEIKELEDCFTRASLRELLTKFRRSGTTDIHY